MSKIALSPDANGTGVFTIASPNSNTSRTLTLPDDSGTIVTNSGNQAGSFTTLNTSGQVVFNDAGADVDFRVEGDTNANLLFVDASADAVGIGTSSLSASYGKLTVAGTGLTIADDGNAKLQIGRYSSGTPHSYIKMGANSNSLRFTNPADNADLMTLDSSGNVSINGTLAAADLDYSSTVPKITVGDSQYGISSGGSQLHLHTLAGGVTVVNNGTYAGAILHTGNFTSSTVTSALGYTPVSRSSVYTNTVSLSGKSAGSWYDLIPTNALSMSTTYIVNVDWSHATSGVPYVFSCSFLLRTTYSNGSGTGNSFTPICSTHVGSGYTFSFRGLFASGFVATGLQFSPSFTGDGNITVNCVLIG